MATSIRSRSFTNWAGNQVCLPARRATPSSTAEVADLVARASAEGTRVKVVGAGHSFTDAACTDGLLLSLDRMDRVERIDTEHRRITVQAGIRLHALNDVLADVGLAMPNLGDIAYQSIAGAIATATHGTGLTKGNLATTIVAMELVDGKGDVVWCDEQHRPDLLQVARVGIGALGVITKVTIQCVEAFNLHVAESVEPVDEVLAEYRNEVETNAHFEFFWFPGTTKAQVKRNNPTRRAAEPPSRVAYARDKILTENLAFGALNRIARRVPRTTPFIARTMGAALGRRELVDRSDRVFASPRLVRFYEMEYRVRLDDFEAAFGAVRQVLGGLAMPTLFPVECRVSAADDIPLSTGHGEPSAWLAFHVYQGTSYDAYFQAVERVLDAFDGRPHWGKLHFQNHHTLRHRYPEWDTFTATRAELDPAGTFANAYLDRVLGPVATATASVRFGRPRRHRQRPQG